MRELELLWLLERWGFTSRLAYHQAQFRSQSSPLSQKSTLEDLNPFV